MDKIRVTQRTPRRQVKSLNPQDDTDLDSEIYGDENYRSTQVITNYYYMPFNRE